MLCPTLTTHMPWSDSPATSPRTTVEHAGPHSNTLSVISQPLSLGSLGSLACLIHHSHASYTVVHCRSLACLIHHSHASYTVVHCRSLAWPYTTRNLACLLHCRTLSLSRMAIHSKLLHEDTHPTTLFSSEQQDTMTKQYQTFCLHSFWLSLAFLACLFWNSECEGQAVHLSFLSSPIFRVYITHVCLVFVFICVIN